MSPLSPLRLKVGGHVPPRSYGGAAHGVNGDWLCQREMAIFDPPQNKYPLTDHQKIGTGDYVVGPYGCAKFGANPSIGGFWANRWNTNFFYLYPFFMNSPTGETRRQIFTLDDSNDADSRKDVPFGVSLTLLPILGVKSPKTPIFRAWIGVFKPNGQNIESFMLSKLLHRFQPNFAQR